MTTLLAGLVMAWQVHAAPVAGTAFSVTDEAKVQTLSPQNQEQVRKALAEAQGSGINIQALTLLQQPKFNGVRLDFCLLPMNNLAVCGDANATLACKVAGFTRSLPNGWAVENVQKTFYLAGDFTCDGACGAFSYVICQN
jgi:hypothetical protein